MAEPPEVQLVKEEGPNAPANNGSVARSDADVVVLGASSPTRPRKRDASAVDVLGVHVLVHLNAQLSSFLMCTANFHASTSFSALTRCHSHICVFACLQ